MDTTPLHTIHNAVLFGSIEDISIQTIIAGLQVADDLYFNGEESPLSDFEYDAIADYARRMDPTNAFFTGIGSSVRGGKVRLPYTMGSLNQVFQGDYAKWVEKYSLQKETLIISNKLDGNSGMVVYDADTGKLQIAFSRGDGTSGADITRHISKIHNVPQCIDNVDAPLTVRGEVIITPVRFNQIKDKVLSQSGRKYKNPRNFVSGRMNASEGQDIVYEHIEFVAYEIVNSPLSKLRQLELLSEYGFKVVKYEVAVADTLTDSRLTEILNQVKSESEYELDGLVIEINSMFTRNRVSPTKDTLNPEYSVKFKVADASNYAEPAVVGVELNVSKDGFIKPTILIEPTNLVGVTISRCTGFNMAFILNNQIQPGTKIKLTRAGDVTPCCLGVVTRNQPPTELELDQFDEWYHDTVLEQVGTLDCFWTSNADGENVDLVVNNVQGNATAMFQRLADFFSSLDVANLGEGNLRPMFDAGFETPESIIELTQEELGSLIRSSVTGKKIFKSIREKLTNIPMYVLMGSHAALGRGVGKRRMKKLWDAFAGDMTKCVHINNIIAVEGFDVKTATKIVNGYVEFAEFFQCIQKFTSIAAYVAPAQGSLSGKVITFTGMRSKELELAIEARGGKIGSSVSSKTSILVTNDPTSTSGKAQKARDLGIPVIGEKELRAML